MKYAEFPKVTRITVVTDNGAEFERYAAFSDGAEIHLQDGGRTLKVFPRLVSPTAVETPDDALSFGGLLGLLMRAGLDAYPVLDIEGNYTNTVRVELGEPFNRAVFLRMSRTAE